MDKKDITTDPKYTIGIAAKRLGVSVHALRLYESEGLILPCKTETNRRIYSDLEIEKIKCIKNMIHVEGLNFAGIRRVLALVPCWKIKGCNTDNGQKCVAYNTRTYPCWSAKEDTFDERDDCRECIVYQTLVECDDIRDFLQNSTCNCEE